MQLPLVINGCGVLEIKGPAEGEVASLCYYSRQCRPGSLFVAVRGLKTDGHLFITDAVSRGATFVVHEGDYQPPPGVTGIRVADSRRALGTMAKNFFGDPSRGLCLIAVVGTNGKTTVTYLIEAILKAAGLPCGVLGTVNYRYPGRVMAAPNTTPESFEMQRILREMADAGISHVVAEVSSHAIDLRRVDDCTFARGVFTNLSQDHLDYHKTMEAYFQAKRRFFAEVLPAGTHEGRPAMVVNGDDPWGRRILADLAQDKRLDVVTYGLDAASTVCATESSFDLEGIKAVLSLNGDPLEVRSPLLGSFNLANIMAAAAAAFSLAVPKEKIAAGIAALKNVPGRLEKVGEKGRPAVFVDYAHTEDALTRVLETLSPLRKGRIITVFGCGGDRDRTKRPRMGAAAARGSDLAVVTSDNPRTEDPLAIIAEIEKGMCVPKLADLSLAGTRRGYVVIPDRREAIAAAIAAADEDDIVLIAGKGHEDYQIVGAKKFPFDDRVVASQELARRERGGRS